MEFEFKTDYLNDSFRAEFSMGHEAVGHWLVAELGTDIADIKALLIKLEQIKAQENTEQLIEGRDFSLTLTPNDVVIKANVLHLEAELPEGEDLSNYDDESFSECGIEDFEAMLDSWMEFIINK
ncbi:MAG: YacL family protein [Gammaproteobacteria bacterium]|nr:YacL family protein [Gammaproteobacteria bacterium]